MFSKGNRSHVSVSGSEMYAKFSLKILGRKFISVYRKTRRISGTEYRKLKVLFYFHPKQVEICFAPVDISRFIFEMQVETHIAFNLKLSLK